MRSSPARATSRTRSVPSTSTTSPSTAFPPDRPGAAPARKAQGKQRRLYPHGHVPVGAIGVAMACSLVTLGSLVARQQAAYAGFPPSDMAPWDAGAGAFTYVARSPAGRATARPPATADSRCRTGSGASPLSRGSRRDEQSRGPGFRPQQGLPRAPAGPAVSGAVVVPVVAQ